MSEKFHIRSRADLPVYRSINNVATLMSLADKYGIDARALLSGSGIEMNDLEDPLKLITTVQELSFCRKVIHLVPVPWMGLEFGQHLHLSAKGKVGMAAICCETALDALKMMISYIDLLSSYFEYDIKIDGDIGYARMKELINLNDIRRFICEVEFVSLYTLVSLILEETAIFKEFRLAYPAPEYADKYKEVLHCPVLFDAPEHMIV
ncbi:MAG: AraC family transcriptional regulator, partial [Deltaproteobacteria bacterium]|nr:AraC family transcriptional regulator [Deltaproteobacteria bacterium]